MELNFALEDIAAAAKQLLALTPAQQVYAFHGEMGAGKTTFIHAFCEALGVQDNISSPTFSIINQYTSATGQTVYHMDLYRLKDEAEAIDSGVEDCLYSGNSCLVEWPEKAPNIFPPETLHVQITVVKNNVRRIAYDAR